MTLRTVTYDDTEYQLVPKEPTIDMMNAAFPSESDKIISAKRGEFLSRYSAMLAAAPQPQSDAAPREIEGLREAIATLESVEDESDLEAISNDVLDAIPVVLKCARAYADLTAKKGGA